MIDHETTLRAIAQHGTTGAIYDPSPAERAACLAGADALRAQPDVIEAIHKDVLARIRKHITPRLNTPTQADVLDLLGHVNAAFSAAKDAALDAGADALRRTCGTCQFWEQTWPGINPTRGRCENYKAFACGSETVTDDGCIKGWSPKETDRG